MPMQPLVLYTVSLGCPGWLFLIQFDMISSFFVYVTLYSWIAMIYWNNSMQIEFLIGLLQITFEPLNLY